MVRWLLGGFLIKAEGRMEQPCLRQWEHEGEKLHIMLDQKEQEDLPKPPQTGATVRELACKA